MSDIVLLPDGSLQCMNCDIVDRKALAEIDKALRSTPSPSQAAGELELYSLVSRPLFVAPDATAYEPIPEAVAVIEAARMVLNNPNDDTDAALARAFKALDKRLNPKVENG